MGSPEQVKTIAAAFRYAPVEPMTITGWPVSHTASPV
jgi:hypothetical protein